MGILLILAVVLFSYVGYVLYKNNISLDQAVTFAEVLLHQLKNNPNLDRHDQQSIQQAITMLREAESTLYGK